MKLFLICSTLQAAIYHWTTIMTYLPPRPHFLPSRILWLSSIQYPISLCGQCTTILCWKLAWCCTFCPNCYMLLLYSCCMCGCCWREALIFSSIIWCVQVSNVKFNILVRQLKLFYIGKQSQPFSFLLRQNKIKRMIPLYVLSFGIWDFFSFIYMIYNLLNLCKHIEKFFNMYFNWHFLQAISLEWFNAGNGYVRNYLREIGSRQETAGSDCLRIQVTFREFEMNFTRMKYLVST